MTELGRIRRDPVVARDDGEGHEAGVEDLRSLSVGVDDRVHQRSVGWV